jgi:hypothetical protein
VGDPVVGDWLAVEVWDVREDSLGDPVVDCVVEPVTDSLGDPVVDCVVEPVTDPLTDPLADRVVEPLTDTLADPVKAGEAVPDTLIERVVEPLVEGLPEILITLAVGDTVSPLEVGDLDTLAVCVTDLEMAGLLESVRRGDPDFESEGDDEIDALLVGDTVSERVTMPEGVDEGDTLAESLGVVLVEDDILVLGVS